MIPKSGYRFSEKIMHKQDKLKRDLIQSDQITL